MHTDELRQALGPARENSGSRHVTTPDMIAKLFELADRARRLPPPNHRNPHAFHEARSELGSALEQLAEDLGGRRTRVR